MASLIDRIREVVSANAHHRLDQLEDPRVMSQQMLRDLGQDLLRANRALVTALGAEKALARHQAQLSAEGADWRARAERLVATAQDDLARGALERALDAETRAADQQRPLDTAREATARLREQVARLKSEWESARARCAQIAANQSAAEALGAASRLGDAYTQAIDRAQRLDQLSRKAAAFECENEAAAELLGERERFEDAVARAGRVAAVDAAMAQFKARAGAASAAAGEPAAR